MVSKLDYGIRGNFNPFLPANGLTLDGTNVSGSTLFSLSVGGSTKFSVNNTGLLNLMSGTSSIQVDPANSSLTFSYAFPRIVATGAGNASIVFKINGIDNMFNFGGSFIGFGATGSTDTYFGRDAAGILAQRNTTSAQSFRLYNTYTDASNYERAVFDWQTTANVLRIGTENAGTGSARNIAFVSGGSVRLDFGYTAANVWTTPHQITTTSLNIATTITPGGSGSGTWLFAAGSGYKSIQTYDSATLALNPIGNYVGIGVYVAQYLLDVNGTARFGNTTTSTVISPTTITLINMSLTAA